MITFVKTSWCVSILAEVAGVKDCPVQLVDSDVVIEQPLPVVRVHKHSSYRNDFFEVAPASNQQFLHKTLLLCIITYITHILGIKLHEPFAIETNWRLQLRKHKIRPVDLESLSSELLLKRSGH